MRVGAALAENSLSGRVFEHSQTGAATVETRVIGVLKMMHKIGLADELAEIRAEIARLKDREAALEAAVHASEGTVPDGRTSRVAVVTRRQTDFDPALLPREVRDNPRYWREQINVRVECTPIEGRGTRPGWPIHRLFADPLQH